MLTPEQEKDFEDAATFIESLHAGRRKEGRAILSRLRALLEVSAGEALREAHNKLIRAADPARMDSHHRQEFELEAHAALDAAVAAAVREEREAAIESLKRFGPAHTYASENADHYRGFDAGVQRCIERLRSRCEVKE
jgi:hypothetical protein